MRSYLAKKLINFSGTLKGQKTIFLMQKMPFELWAKSRIVRQRIAFLASHNNQVVEIEKKISWSDYLESIRISNSHRVSASNSRLRIVIYSPDAIHGMHTISQLALYQKNILKDNFATFSCLFRRSDTSIYEAQFDQCTTESKPNFNLNQNIQIFHLGNSSSSILSLEYLFSSNCENSIIVLHDLWLGDLFESYGHWIGIPTLTSLLVEAELGDWGVINLEKMRSGDEILENVRTKIHSVLLNIVLQHCAKAISHSSSPMTQISLNTKFPEKFCFVDMPKNFFSETALLSKKIDEDIYTIIITGHGSYTKNLRLILVALVVVQNSLINIKIKVGGDLVREVRQIISEDPYLKILSRVILYKQSLNQQEWQEFHTIGAVGIRINVGKNGESSGLIRDYLWFGMKVVGDEDVEELRADPNYYLLDKHLDATNLSKTILHALKMPYVKADSDKFKINSAYKTALNNCISCVGRL